MHWDQTPESSRVWEAESGALSMHHQSPRLFSALNSRSHLKFDTPQIQINHTLILYFKNKVSKKDITIRLNEIEMENWNQRKWIYGYANYK